VAKVEAAYLSLTAHISRSNFSSCYIKNPIFDFDGDYPVRCTARTCNFESAGRTSDICLFNHPILVSVLGCTKRRSALILSA